MKKALTSVAAVLLLAACTTDPPKDPARVVTSSTDVTSGRLGTTGDRGLVDPRRSMVDIFKQDVGTADRVFFPTDRTDLTSEAQTILRQQVAWLQRYQNVTVTIAGHADERGTREYNLALGDRRATTVRNFLVASGVAPSRIHTVSYGKEMPAIVGSDDAAWSKNRRGVTSVE